MSDYIIELLIAAIPVIRALLNARYRVRMSDEVEKITGEPTTWANQTNTWTNQGPTPTHGMSEPRVALAVALQAHAMDGGRDQEGAADLVLRVMASHAGEVLTWHSTQKLVAEVRAAAQGGK